MRSDEQPVISVRTSELIVKSPFLPSSPLFLKIKSWLCRLYLGFNYFPFLSHRRMIDLFYHFRAHNGAHAILFIILFEIGASKYVVF